MEELDTLRSGARRHEDLVTMFRYQVRQCQDLLMDARAVWSDRAAERAWKRNIEPQLADADKGERQLELQARHLSDTLTHTEQAAEHTRAAMASAETVASSVEQVLEDSRRTEQLAADAASQAASAASAAAAALAQIQGF